MSHDLALLGGEPAVQRPPGDLFDWPIVTPEMEQAVLAVLRAGNMSGTDVTRELEREYAAWQGTRHALAHSSGTAALHAAMFAVGVGHGDEVICPSMTYWASGLPAYSLGGTVRFADIDPDTLCIAPSEVQRLLTPRTRAVVAVHYAGHPADMDALLAIARPRGIAVIEDVSHAHGALYKGRPVGTLGDVAAASLMAGKSLACGEGGMLVTDDERIYQRAALFGHYERVGDITLPDLAPGAALPWGGHKYRMHQLTSAVARVQVHNYPAQMAEVDRAMNRFWDLLEGCLGVRGHRPVRGSGTTMGGWYAATGLYDASALGGLSLFRFVQALQAEGVPTRQGRNKPLHLHPLFQTVDVYGEGRPTRISRLPEGVDIREAPGSLPVSEGLYRRAFAAPWFKHDRPAEIGEYAAALRKVIDGYEDLLPDDPGDPPDGGGWGLTVRRDS